MLIRITDTVGTTGSVMVDTDNNHAHTQLAPLFEDSPREVQDAVIEVSALIDRGTLFTDPTGPGLLHYLGLSAERLPDTRTLVIALDVSDLDANEAASLARDMRAQVEDSRTIISMIVSTPVVEVLAEYADDAIDLITKG